MGTCWNGWMMPYLFVSFSGCFHISCRGLGCRYFPTPTTNKTLAYCECWLFFKILFGLAAIWNLDILDSALHDADNCDIFITSRRWGLLPCSCFVALVLLSQDLHISESYCSQVLIKVMFSDFCMNTFTNVNTLWLNLFKCDVFIFILVV